MKQLHKKFTDNHVKEFIERYLAKEIELDYILTILGIKRRRFFVLVSKYRQDATHFSIQYLRKTPTRRIDQNIEKNILKELKIEKNLIHNKEIPLKSYNYSYVKDHLENKYKQRVSLNTIIDRAKKNHFYIPRPERTAHDREVLTHYIGEMIQHDSSYHLWAPYAQEKWYLITSIDDFSRFIFYAKLLKKETSWAHIVALQTVVLKYGVPFSYYVDCHSVFRFVQGRDSFWRTHHKLTDDVDPQWKQVLRDCNIKPIYALSPQAKGKVERPYGWIQDRLVRTCAREQISDIRPAQKILDQQIRQYNYRWVHSTTKEIPYLRFQRALEQKQSLFREFKIIPPYQAVKDIFALRIDRTVDPYRRISINNLQLSLHGANPRQKVTLRIHPMTHGISEVRFWCKDKLLDVQHLKTADLNLPAF